MTLKLTIAALAAFLALTSALASAKIPYLGTKLNQFYFRENAEERLMSMKRDPSGLLDDPQASTHLSPQRRRQLWMQRVSVLKTVPRFLGLSTSNSVAKGIKPTELSLEKSSTPHTIVEASFAARGTTERDEHLFTWIYYFDYEATTGALVRYGARLASTAEASEAGLPTNNLQSWRIK